MTSVINWGRLIEGLTEAKSINQASCQLMTVYDYDADYKSS